jgi:hypothetical protein
MLKLFTHAPMDVRMKFASLVCDRMKGRCRTRERLRKEKAIAPHELFSTSRVFIYQC